MGSILGIIIGMEMWNRGISGMRTAMRTSMECWNSRGCDGIGNLYILTVVVMIDDSN